MHYRNETRCCALADLDAPLRALVLELADKRALGDLSTAFCAHTHSVRSEKPGMLARLTGLGGPEHMDVALVIGTKHVVVARTAPGEESFAMGAPLATLMLDELPTELKDEGIGLTADWTRGGGPRVSYLVKLGEPDRAAVIEAVRRAIGG